VYTINYDWTEVTAVIDDYCVYITREVKAVYTRADHLIPGLIFFPGNYNT